MSNVATFADASTSGFENDLAAIAREIIARRLEAEANRIQEMMELQRQDDCRCRGCGDLTEGSDIFGVHVHACPDCLAKHAATHGWSATPAAIA